MLRLRLQRRGKKNYATYRVVVADQRAPIKGRFVADVGSYNPHTDAFVVNKDKVTEWIGKGVQPSNTVHNLLVTNGVIKREKVTSWKPKKKEASEEDAAKEDGVEKPKEESSPEEARDKTEDKEVVKADTEKSEGESD